MFFLLINFDSVTPYLSILIEDTQKTTFKKNYRINKNIEKASSSKWQKRSQQQQ